MTHENVPRSVSSDPVADFAKKISAAPDDTELLPIPAPPKRGPGRPRKYPLPPLGVQADPDNPLAPPVPKRGRGRPRKVEIQPLPEIQALAEAVPPAPLSAKPLTIPQGPPTERKRKPSTRIPGLCFHRATNQGYVFLNGKTFYLGDWSDPATERAYNRKIAEWLAAGRQLPVDPNDITVGEVVTRFWNHALGYYRNPDGEISTELDNFQLSLRPVLALYKDTAAREFGPLSLRTVREQMINAAKLSRGNINKRIARIKYVFRWAVSMQLVPGEVSHALETLAGLRRGRTVAREGKRVKPAPMELIEAIKPHVSRQVWTIIQLQLLTGARPGEILRMRPADIDRSREVWIYQPDKHKTRNWGHERFIYIGPRAQDVLQPYLLRPVDAYCFSALEAERERYQEMRALKMTRGWRPQFHKRERPQTGRKVADHYTLPSYRRAIERGLEWAFPLPEHLRKRYWEGREKYQARLTPEMKAEIKAWKKAHHWHPHQLRHNAGTEVRKEFDIETARVVLGHRSVDATTIYAEQAREKAVEAMKKLG